MLRDDIYRRITYYPTVEEDLRKGTVFKGWTHLNDTLANDAGPNGKYELLFHGNSELKATENSRDVTQQLGMRRENRFWKAPVVQGEPVLIAGRYELASDRNARGGFAADGGTRSWVDAPGSRELKRVERGFRLLQDFITGIVDPRQANRLLPQFGGLYYWVAVDVTPASYRVIMSLEKRLNAEQISGALGLPGKPFPVDVIKPDRPPKLEEWRFVSHDWLDYTPFKKWK